jgi:hypothetical protein
MTTKQQVKPRTLRLQIYNLVWAAVWERIDNQAKRALVSAVEGQVKRVVERSLTCIDTGSDMIRNKIDESSAI